MEANELRTKSAQELGDLVQSLKTRLQSLGFDLHAGKVKNIREIREVKKDIARVLTVLQSLKKH